MILDFDTFPIAAGTFTVASDETGAVVATAFGGARPLASRLPRPLRTGRLVRNADALATIRTQIVEYFEGRRSAFDLPLRPIGSPFQQRVWQELQRIPAGETQTYGQLARRLRSSPRAIGRANATNPICVLVPCHRVIGSDGSLTGFAFGEDLKHWLLTHERESARVQPATGPIRGSN